VADAPNGPAAGAFRLGFCRLPSGGEALEEPRAVELAAKAEPVVEPARSALPKLDPLGHEPKSPQFGGRGIVSGHADSEFRRWLPSTKQGPGWLCQRTARSVKSL